ncbi:RimJ/RimL family protein N-acetyltransferase [Paraburkholderia bryophila]|uniref:RimJ/RimL family protein N-acetyltransferase n=2 Tax=Paraburkholderia bryophila TaxID=420952 RepID=A0A329BEN3_9BURK|nr:RimJ/RimL family protein N-acetyltransferase [Paraburkholderia bryophila]
MYLCGKAPGRLGVVGAGEVIFCGDDQESMLQPVFETQRLILLPRTLADTDDCLAMDSDPEVTRFVAGPWGDRVKHRAFVESRTLADYPVGMGYWTIRLRADPTEFLGWILLIPTDASGAEIEIGWRLPRKIWGSGIATEAARPVLQHAFATLALPEVVAEIDARNLGSMRVAEKLGLVRRGEVGHEGAVSVRCTVLRPC